MKKFRIHHMPGAQGLMLSERLRPLGQMLPSRLSEMERLEALLRLRYPPQHAARPENEQNSGTRAEPW